MEGATDCKVIFTGHASTAQGRLVWGCRVGVWPDALAWLWGGDGDPTRGEAGVDQPEAVQGNQRPDQRPDQAGSLAPLGALLPPQGDSPWHPPRTPLATRAWPYTRTRSLAGGQAYPRAPTRDARTEYLIPSSEKSA